MVSPAGTLTLVFWVLLEMESPIEGTSCEQLCWFPLTLVVIGSFKHHNLLMAAQICGWQPTTINMKTPWRVFKTSVTYQRLWGPPTAQEVTSAIHVMPMTITNLMQTLPKVALEIFYQVIISMKIEGKKNYRETG